MTDKTVAPAAGPTSPVAAPGISLGSVMNRIEAVLADALVMGEPKPHPAGDVSTGLSYERTDLALERSSMAAERTLQAWIRTALSMISFGFTIGKLGQAVQGMEVRGAFNREWSLQSLAYMLVIMGTVSLAAACVQHWIALRQLRARGLRRQLSIASVVAVLLIALGAFAFSALVLEL